LKLEGKVRSIGVSNYGDHHLEELLRWPKLRIKPVVNQIEVHPFCQRRQLVAFCAAHGIGVQAYSPLARAKRLGDATVQAIAMAHKRSAAQVMIRWSLQKGFISLPKSARPTRIKENALVFDFALSDEEVAALDALEEGYNTGWEPMNGP
jgi:diketogulonate reductase-like aldo/keto reductase